MKAPMRHRLKLADTNSNSNLLEEERWIAAVGRSLRAGWRGGITAVGEAGTLVVLQFRRGDCVDRGGVASVGKTLLLCGGAAWGGMLLGRSPIDSTPRLVRTQASAPPNTKAAARTGCMPRSLCGMLR